MDFQPRLPLPVTDVRVARRGGSATHAAPARRAGRPAGPRAAKKSPSKARRAVTAPPSPVYAHAQDWRLDDATRRTGRQGLETARAALARIASQHGGPSSGAQQQSDAA